MEKLKSENQKQFRHLLNKKSKIDSLKTANVAAVTSPLARYQYSSDGKLTCIICRTVVKSANVWKIHVNSKQHKESITIAKTLKDKPLQPEELSSRSSSIKPVQATITHPVSTILNINKQTIKESENTTFNKQIIKPATIPLLVHNKEEPTNNLSSKGPVPEEFFDQVKNTKLNNSDLKEQDEEWDRFQREIREETATSNVIITGDQIQTAADQHIKEINDQMERWKRVINLQERREQMSLNIQVKENLLTEEIPSSDDTDNEEEISDWRCKKLK